MKLAQILTPIALLASLVSCSSMNRYAHTDALTGGGAQELSPVTVGSGEGMPILELGGRIPAYAGAWPGLVSTNASVAEVIYLDGNQRNELGHTAALVGKRRGTTTVYYVPDRREWAGGTADSGDARLNELQSFEVTVQ